MLVWNLLSCQAQAQSVYFDSPIYLPEESKTGGATLNNQFYYEVGADQSPSTACLDELALFQSEVIHECEDISRGIFLLKLGIDYHSPGSSLASGCHINNSLISSAPNLDAQMVEQLKVHWN